MTAYQDFVRSEMKGFHGTRVQMNLKMKEVGARWRAHKSGAGVSRGRGLQSDIKSALANVDLNQLKNIDYSKAGSYITGSGIKRRGRGVSGEGLKIVKRTGNVVRRKNNVVRKAGRGFFGNLIGGLIGRAIGGATGNADRGQSIGGAAGSFLPF